MDKHNLKHNRFNRLCVFTIIVLLLIVMVGTVAWQLNVQANASARALAHPLLSLPSTVNLTIIALNGTRYFFNSSQIASLSSTTGPGGMYTGVSPSSTSTYTGVSLSTLANLVGGVSSGEILQVEGMDGYTRNFTYAQVNGNFTAYNATSGASVSPTKLFTPIIAYYNDSQLIPGNSSGGDGPLMVAIVGNASLVTPGKYWVKWVDKLTILPTTIPEYPSMSLLPLLVALTLVAVVSSVYLSRKSKKLLFHEKR